MGSTGKGIQDPLFITDGSVATDCIKAVIEDRKETTRFIGTAITKHNLLHLTELHNTADSQIK